MPRPPLCPLKTSLAVVLLFLFSNAFSQEQYRYQMKLLDGSTYQPISGAVIRLDSLGKPVYTNRLGWFEIIGEERDTLTLWIYHRKYGRIKERVWGKNRLIVIGNRDQSEIGFWYPSNNFSEIEWHSRQVIQTDKKNISGPSEAALLLQHQLPGLTVTRAGNDPNQPFGLHIRGMSSASQRNSPLIVVDGIPETSLARINPEDVAFLEITKSTVGTAQYGVFGGGGIIEVHTPEYDTSMPTVTYHSSIGMEAKQKGIPVMDADEYRQNKPSMWDGGHSTDWVDEITRTGLSHRHHLALAKGDGRRGFYSSLGYERMKGVLKNSGLEQGNFRINYSSSSKDGRKKVTLKNAFLQRNNRMADVGLFSDALLFNPTLPVYNENGEYTRALQSSNLNPIATLNQQTQLGRTREWSSILQSEGFISPHKKTDWFVGLRNRKHILGSANYIPNLRGRFIYNDWDRKQAIFGISTSNQREHKRLIEKTEIGFHGSFMMDKNSSFSVNVADLPTLNFKNLEKKQSYWDENSSIDHSDKIARYQAAAFLKREYVWDIWRINLGARYDHLTIEEQNKGNLSYHARIASDLTQLFDLKWMDYTRLSVGFGKTGQVAGYGWSQNPISYLLAGEYQIARPAKEDFFEQKTEIDVQLKMSLFNGRLTGVINLYDNLLYDQYLFNGFKADFGNKGAEANFFYKNRPGAPVQWESNLGFFTNKTVAYKFNKTGEMQRVSSIISSFNYSWLWLEPYGEISQFRGFKTNGEIVNGEYQRADLDGDGVPDETHLGSPLPKMGFQLTNQLSWKKWDATFKIRSILGHKLLNQSRQYWEFTGDNEGNEVKTKYFDEKGSYNQILDAYLENASFAKLDYLSIGYSPPLKKGNLRLYLAGHDLLTINGYTGIDPEPRFQDQGTALAGGSEWTSTHWRTRRMVFGVQFAL